MIPEPSQGDNDSSFHQDEDGKTLVHKHQLRWAGGKYQGAKVAYRNEKGVYEGG